MATLNIYNYIEITTDEGDTFEAGSRTTPTSITLTNGDIHEKRITLAEATNEAVMWTSSESGFTSFEFLYFETDKDCYLELEDNTSGTPLHHQIKVNANAPLLLGHDELGGDAIGDNPTTLCVNIEVEAISDDTRVRLILMK